MSDLAERAFRRHYGQIYRFVRRRTQDHHRAEELAQEVFTAAAASLRHDASEPLAWLYTVARRRFADEARRRARERRLVPLEPVPPTYAPAVSAAISRALAGLPAAQRQVVVLKLLRGASFAEIAHKVGATEAAVKMRFSRALRALRDELQQEGIEP